MQLLIVHDDAEVGELLMSMVREYTAHQCDLVEGDVAAHAWARQHGRCGLLLAQLEGREVDGLLLGGSLSEVFPGLQTFFFPAYPASEQRFEIVNTRVFPEPIDGERLLEAIENVAEPGPNARDLFDVLDLLQMCCLSRRRGAVQLVQPAKSGIVYLHDGRIVDAATATFGGLEALLEIAGWGLVEFAYDPTTRGSEIISMRWDEALGQAVGRQEEMKSQERPGSERRQLESNSGRPLPKRHGILSALRWS